MLPVRGIRIKMDQQQAIYSSLADVRNSIQLYYNNIVITGCQSPRNFNNSYIEAHTSVEKGSKIFNVLKGAWGIWVTYISFICLVRDERFIKLLKIKVSLL